MKLRWRVLLISLLLAAPATAVVVVPIERQRLADQQLTIERVVRVQINDQVKERCESDPKWFLTGPLEGRPPQGKFDETNTEVLAPRPKISPQPFELFAYDEQFIASSSAAPRFPIEFRDALRVSAKAVSGPFETPEGTGVQFAIPTEWVASPCAYFLGRLRPLPDLRSQRIRLIASVYAACLVVSLLVVAPLVLRIRRMARVAAQSGKSGFTTIAPDQLRDELSSLTFVYNEASAELVRRHTRIDDQDAAIRRIVQDVDDDVAAPLEALEAEIGAMEIDGAVGTPERLRDVLSRAHDLTDRAENLTAAARLRLGGASVPVSRVDLDALVARVGARHRPSAHAAGVSLEVNTPGTPIAIEADEALVARAVANVFDNAIRYNRRGGRVTMTLTKETDGRFRLLIADNGPGVNDEEFRGLTAVRRFRGDEHRIPRRGGHGVGLAVAREVCDRFGLTLELNRPGAGLEVEIGGRVSP